MEYKISNDQFIIEYEGFRIIMELKEKFFAQYLNSLAPEQWVDLLIADHSFREYCACREKFNSRNYPDTNHSNHNRKEKNYGLLNRNILPGSKMYDLSILAGQKKDQFLYFQ